MNKTEAPVSDELTRQQYCLIIEELPVEYTDAVGENIDKLLKHDAALRAQLASCQEQVRLTKGAMDAQDGREREAGEKCGVDYNIHGCDWPDAAAELIVHLRAKLTAMEQDNKRLDVENNQLWAVFKTCHGCKYVVPGVMFGCPIQHHIDLSGNCNQYEKAGE